ncbi:MAG TPA: SDR family NAD(P)-dependent oxidoreductase [Terriglobia bacterium]|nr:SDR family NAD(P)-dependent oxidoreductase [Terriglobia bacterium]
MPNWLDGKTAVVTGAGRGIGRATAQLLAAEGARLMVTDLDEEPLAYTASSIRAAGGTTHALVSDVTAPGFPSQLLDATLKQFGGLDILVNNAGFTWDGTIHKMTDEQWHSMLNVHLTAPFQIIRAAAPYFRETAKREIAERGAASPRKIVNVSSTSGTRGNFGQANYAAAKAGIIGLTKSLAREWGALNIQVNCVAFGFIDTRLTQNKETGERVQRGETGVALGIPAAMRDATFKLIPLGRPGTPREAAGAILFLASPLSDYVSGQVLEVTGGW